jgi:predicted outer membrane repeat protein
MPFRKATAFLVLIGALTVTADRAESAVVSNCNESSLEAALGAGGVVTFNCSGTIVFSSTKQIAGQVTIDGAGQAVSLSGNDTVRLFVVQSGATLVLRNLTLAHGLEDDQGLGGGAIRNSFGGTLVVTDSQFFENSGVSGGAISNSGTATISRTTFSENAAELFGGAISSTGPLQVTDSSFEGNRADAGGALFTQLSLHTISGTTFANNEAADVGGGIANVGGLLRVVNSTFAGNAAETGGGIYTGDSFIGSPVGTADLGNVTFSLNSGGALYNSELVTLTNTILANSVSGPDCALRQVETAHVSDGGGNLVEDGSCGFPTASDPQLGPLASNGGVVQTMAIPLASPAFAIGVRAACDAPFPAGAGGRDQRGFYRWNCSAGAFEPTPELFRRVFPVAARDGG